jgi:hypothetical protein
VCVCVCVCVSAYSRVRLQLEVVVLLVGSLGLVHKRFVSGLNLLGVSPIRRVKGIAKYCSVSATIGSRIIWKQRCRDTN